MRPDGGPLVGIEVVRLGSRVASAGIDAGRDRGNVLVRLPILCYTKHVC